MQTDLWNTALAIYAQPRVEQACLELQNDGADICLLLCALWLGRRGVTYDDQRAQELEALSEPWQTAVVSPLRQLRRAWREGAARDADLHEVREQIKVLELEAERRLLLRLQARTHTWPAVQATDLEQWMIRMLPGQAGANYPAQQVLREALAIA